MQHISLITKTSTQNQGNQALSMIWLAVLQRLFPQACVSAIERGPLYYKRFRLDALKKESSPLAAYDRIADRLATLRASPEEAAAVRTDRIRYQRNIKQPKHMVGLRRLVALKARLATLGYGKRTARARIQALRESSLVVVNPAGEFLPEASDTAIAYLLELSVAQRLNIPCALVNVSLEMRDQASADAYREWGGKRPCDLIPDMALYARHLLGDLAASRVGKRVGLVINGRDATAAEAVEGWKQLAARLTAEGHEVVLYSNEFTTDEPHWRQWGLTANHEAIGLDLDFQSYVGQLATCSALVSNRLHTSILASCAGIPVIPVEGAQTKISGFYRMLGMDGHVIRTDDEAWTQGVIHRIGQALADPAGCIAAVTTPMRREEERAIGLLQERLAARA